MPNSLLSHLTCWRVTENPFMVCSSKFEILWRICMRRMQKLYCHFLYLQPVIRYCTKVSQSFDHEKKLQHSSCLEKSAPLRENFTATMKIDFFPLGKPTLALVRINTWKIRLILSNLRVIPFLQGWVFKILHAKDKMVHRNTFRLRLHFSSMTVCHRESKAWMSRIEPRKTYLTKTLIRNSHMTALHIVWLYATERMPRVKIQRLTSGPVRIGQSW